MQAATAYTERHNLIHNYAITYKDHILGHHKCGEGGEPQNFFLGYISLGTDPLLEENLPSGEVSWPKIPSATPGYIHQV